MKIQNYSINSFIPIKKSSVAYVEKQKQIENKATVPFYNFIPSLKAQLSFGSSTPIDLNIFCKKHGKVTQKEFERIKKLHPSMIQKAYELLNERYNGEVTPNKIASSAILFKNYLDKKYDGNYRIISVGTSPYQIAQAMQYLGSNVAYIPISCLSAYNFDDENSKYQNLEISLKYLEEQLNKMPHDENTKDIILDYFNTGKTINNLWTILVERGFETQDSLIGMPVDTLFEESMRTSAEFLENFYENYEDDMCLYTLQFDVSNDMNTSTIGYVSNIPHFEYFGNFPKYTYDEAKKKFENYSLPLARCFNLCVLNELDKFKELNDLS